MPEKWNSTSKERIPPGIIIDITLPISPSTPVYPGDPIPAFKKVCNLEKDGCEVTALSLGSHTGTHVDAPAHILKAGACVDQLDFKGLMGKALLLDLSSEMGAISQKILELAFKMAGNPKVSVLLLKTVDSKNARTKGFAAPDAAGWLEKEAAAWIVAKGFKTVGVDGFSVDSISSEKGEEGEEADLPAHHILLSNSVNIVECLDLRAAEEGVYYFLCLPLKIEGCDGAPARAVLIADI